MDGSTVATKEGKFYADEKVPVPARARFDLRYDFGAGRPADRLHKRWCAIRRAA